MTTSASPPEAAGPGIDQPDGRVIFGHNQTSRVVHEHLLDPEQRERERAEHARNAHCDHCAGIPDDVLAALRLAFHAVREEGRRGR